MHDYQVEDLVSFLERQFRQGSCILFTGAGFSADARSISGNHLPSGGALAQRIWKHCFPHDAYDNSSLSTLFPILFRRQKEEAITWLRRELTIDPRSLADYYQAYFCVPWARIYTLNIDSLAHAVTERWKLPIVLDACSPRSALPRLEMQAATDGRPRIQYVQIHGRLDDLPDDVTMSAIQYARLPGSNPWLAALTRDFFQTPTVFVGTQLDEPDIWQHFELRSQRQQEDERDHRPPSFLITPTDPGKGRKELLKAYKIEWIQGDACEFAIKVLSRVTSARPAMPPIPEDALAAANVQRQISSAAQRPVPSAYLEGADPIWADILGNVVAPRGVMSDLARRCQDSISTKRPRCVCLVGTAGSGKTTVVMSALARLNAAGVTCHYVPDERGYDWDALWRGLDQTSTEVLAIDAAHRLRRDSLMTLLEAHSAGRRALVLVLVFPSHQVEHFLPREEYDRHGIEEVATPHLQDADIHELLSVLERHKKLGELQGLSPRKRIAAFKGQLGRQLLVAMIKVTSGKELSEKVGLEYESLTAREKRPYALLVLPTTKGAGLTISEMIMALGSADNSMLDGIHRMIRRGLLVAKARGDRYALRHRVVAVEMEKHLQAQRAIEGPIRDLLPMLELRALEHNKVCFSLLRALLSHNFLYQRLGLEGCQQLFFDIESALSRDHHFWVQRAEVELEWGSGTRALQYLRTAQEIQPEDWLVTVGRAHALFRLGCEDPLSEMASEKVEEAVAEISEVIEMHGAKSPHPYHILGMWASRWSNACRWTPERKKDLLRRAKQLVAQGIKLFPTEGYLKAAAKEVERALLMTAVRSSSGSD